MYASTLTKTYVHHHVVWDGFYSGRCSFKDGVFLHTEMYFTFTFSSKFDEFLDSVVVNPNFITIQTPTIIPWRFVWHIKFYILKISWAFFLFFQRTFWSMIFRKVQKKSCWLELRISSKVCTVLVLVSTHWHHPGNLLLEMNAVYTTHVTCHTSLVI